MSNESNPQEDHHLAQLNELDSRMHGGDDGVNDIEEREAPGLLRFMPSLVQEFWTQKAYFTMDQSGSLLMDGFYKNGPLRLDVRPDGTLVAVDKRNRETIIDSFEKLVELNYFWWKQSNTKTSYVVPQRPWIDSFLKKGLVRRKVIYLPSDEEGDEVA